MEEFKPEQEVKPEILQCESYNTMEASVKNMIQEFTAVVFEKDELDFRDMSEVKSLLPLIPYQDSIPMWRSYFKILRNEQSFSGIKISRLTP